MAEGEAFLGVSLGLTAALWRCGLHLQLLHGAPSHCGWREPCRAFQKVATEGCGFLLGQVGPRPTGEVEGAAYLPRPCVASSRPLRGSRSFWSLQSVPRRGERGPLGGRFLHLHLPTDIPFLGPLHLRDFPFMWPVTLKHGLLKRRMNNRKKKKKPSLPNLFRILEHVSWRGS